MIANGDITGLVLAGGRGSRMGGVDKGLETFRGRPLARHALERIAPQVGPLLLSANRRLDAYAALAVPFGAAIVVDTVDGRAGPLAGFIAGLGRCRTAYLVTVPCDSPRFPLDLVRQLADAIDRDGADLAFAATRDGATLRPQPVFCMMKRTLHDGLARFIDEGGRKTGDWIARQRAVAVPFDDALAFVNANTREDLARLEAQAG